MSYWVAGGLAVNQVAGDPLGLDLTGSQAAADALSNSSATSSKVLQEGTLAANNQLYSSYGDAQGYLDPYMEGGQTAYKQSLLNQGFDLSMDEPVVVKWGNLSYQEQEEYMRDNGGVRPGFNDRIDISGGLSDAGLTANLAPTWDVYRDPNNVDPGAFNFTEGGFEFDPSTVTLDEGWKWRQAEGQQAIDRKLASLGLNMSGGAVKAGARYNQGFLSNEYANAYERQYGRAQDEYASRYGLARDEYGSDIESFNRGYGRDMDAYNMDYGNWQDMMNQLGGVASQGMATSGSLADLAMNYGAGYGNNIMTGAGASASNIMNQGNIGANLATSGWNSAMDIAGLGVQAYTGYQMGQDSGQETFDLENW